MKTKVMITVAAIAVLVLMASSAIAEVIFTESFETPDLTNENTRTPGKWILVGYNNDGNRWPGWTAGGFKYVGIEDTSVSSGVFINAFGDQVAYIFDNLPGGSTDANLTTKSDSLNAALASNMTYTLTFNMASGNSSSINYHVQLLAINGNTATILALAEGPIASNDLAANVGSIVFATGDNHANMGERIAIRLRKGNGYYTSNIYYDNISLSADPIGFSPEEGEIVSAGNVDLRWTNMAPVSGQVYVDVWFGTDFNDLTGVNFKKVVSGSANKTTFTVNAPVANETYYWQVNSYINGSSTGSPVKGAAHSFITADLPPSSLDAGTDMITWSGHGVQLAASVEDDGASTLIYAWNADPNTGVVFSATDIEDPTVTINKVIGDANTVTLTLSVHDAANPTPIKDTVNIDVYDNLCQAGRIGNWMLIDNPTDCDGDCITNLKDFAIMAEFWLTGNELDELALVADAWLDVYSPTSSLINDMQLVKQNETELLSAIDALKDHITGTTVLNDAQIEVNKWLIDDYKDLFASNENIIAACFDLVDAYDDVIGALFVTGSPTSGGLNRSRSNTANDIHWTVYCIMQHIMDVTYTQKNILRYPNLFDGFKFNSSSHFPGEAEPPADPEATHTVKIDGTYLDMWGHEIMHEERPARKPTGTYLAPGSIVTVTVPLSIVGKGYQVRVGAHTWDHSNRPTCRRLDRASLAYTIDSAETKVASPLGGGIYIEVPEGQDAGIVSVQIKNAIRSPYFSAKSFHTTTLAEWQNIERKHPGPWADFQSEKFMMQVPTDWIYNYDDPTAMMQDWDTAMDAMNELMGYPSRTRETMYPQVDLQNRSSVLAPGYPSCNAKYNPNSSYGGNFNHYLLNGPRVTTAPDFLFHEEGHGFLFVKFPGEQESTVNLLHVPVYHEKFGKSLDYAFASSRGFHGNPNRTLDNTAVTWMTVFSFSPKEQPMQAGEKAYQLKGHAKYVDIAKLFGWDGLKAFWYSINEDYENGISWSKHGSNTDDLILRWCQSVGVDLRPLFHFWGIHPVNASALASAIAAEGLQPSAAIYDRLVHFKSIVPADNAAFQSFALGWWGKQPSIGGNWTEREHARQWDSEVIWDNQHAPNGEIYVEESCIRIKAVIDGLIEMYFPDGRPIEN